MKRAILFFLSAMLIISMATPALAAEEGKSYGDVPKTVENIVIDGVKDPMYDLGIKIDITRNLTEDQGDTKAYGTGWVLWSDGFLYTFVDVYDPILVEPDPAAQEATPWTCDSVEIFLDFGNDAADVFQYRIDIAGWPCYYTQSGEQAYGPDAIGSNLISGHKRGTDNYQVEFKIPITEKEGAKIGFQYQMNEVQPDYQTWKMSTSSLNAQSWTPELYDYIVLGALKELPKAADPAPVAEDTPVAAEAAADTPAPAEKANPKTGDNDMMIFALSLVLCGAAFVTIRRQRAK